MESPAVIVWSAIADATSGLSFTFVTVTVTFTLVVRRPPSLALTVILYSLSKLSSCGTSRSGEDRNLSTPLENMLMTLLLLWLRRTMSAAADPGRGGDFASRRDRGARPADIEMSTAPTLATVLRSPEARGCRGRCRRRCGERAGCSRSAG